MQWAKDTSRGNALVDATSPFTLRKRSYICPNPSCGAPVVLHRGGKSTPYFAHASRRADPSCELYVPGALTDRDSQNTPEPSRFSLGLYLNVIEGHNPPFDWTVELVIPEPETDRGSGRLKLPFALGGQRTISVSSIPRGGRRLPVVPTSSGYVIESDGLVANRWSSRIHQRVTGLSDKTVNIFRYSQSGGRCLSDKTPMFWGRTYGLLWTSPTAPGWWPNGLRVRFLKYFQMWGGALVSLPDSYDREVESWIVDYADRRIEYPPCEISLVHPPVDKTLADGSIVISPDEEIIISVSGLLETENGHVVHILDESFRHRQINSHGQKVSIFSLGPAPNGRLDIWAENDIDAALQLLCAKFEYPLPRSSGVELIAEENDSEVRSFLHDQVAKDFLLKVRHGTIHLASIRMSRLIKLIVLWRQNGNEYSKSFSSGTLGDGQQSELFELLGACPSNLLGFSQKGTSGSPAKSHVVRFTTEASNLGKEISLL